MEPTECSQIYDDFWEDRFIERAACDRKCCRRWGMSVPNRVNVRPQPLDLRRRPSGSTLNNAIQVGYQKILRRKVSLAHSRGRY